MNTPTVTPAPGKPNLLLGTYDVTDLGYVAEEFFVSGTADAYSAVGELGPDGRWRAAPSARADYTTRIVVLRPRDAAAFNGTLLVEWLNVSGGIDAPHFGSWRTARWSAKAMPTSRSRRNGSVSRAVRASVSTCR